ncbi:hypothetical protein [Cystobacter fuscus]|uniref:hypothetical protein n=1 Tax=Cystobacter fuscus TaxID=43 RepID=UPI0012DD1FAD|nr:hypothetical protein [Cystobacter fuscus]
MGIFITDGQERLSVEVPDWRESLSWAECYLIVYKASRLGPSGFDRFREGQSLVERMLRTSVVLSSGPDFVPLVHTAERPLFEVVRKEASHGCVSFDSPDSGLLEELENLQHLRHALKKQALHRRYGRSPSPEPQALLRTLFQGKQIGAKPLGFVLQHSSHACIWRWGEFGLHLLSLGQNKRSSIRFVEAAANELDVELIETSSIHKIPAW